MSAGLKVDDLQINLILDGGNYCRLPRNLAGRCGGFTVVRLSSSTCPNSVEYLATSAVVSQSDRIEIPKSLVNKSNSSLLSHESYCDIVLMCNIPDSSEVSLIPASSNDWDVISTQASYVENNMLKEHVLLYNGQIVNVSISPSLLVRLIVQVVTTKPSQVSNDFAIGRITNATTLIIAPYESKPSFSAKDFAQSEKEEEKIEWEQVKFEPHSHLQLLYVLPQKARHQDSSFQCSIPDNNEMISRSDEEIAIQDLSDSYLNSFLEDECEPPTAHASVAVNNYHVANQHSTSVYNSGSDANVCYVHPLYFVAAYEAAIHRTLTTAEWAIINDILHNKVLFGCVESARRNTSAPASTLPGITTTPLTLHAMVRVVISPQTRPGACSLSAAVRKGMNLEACDLVRLYVINERMGAMQLPQSITLSRISLSSSDSVNAAEPPESMVKSAFVRLLEQSSTATVPFILHHNKVLSLVLPKVMNYGVGRAESNNTNDAECSDGKNSDLLGTYENVDFLVQVINRSSSTNNR